MIITKELENGGAIIRNINLQEMLELKAKELGIQDLLQDFNIVSKGIIAVQDVDDMMFQKYKYSSSDKFQIVILDELIEVFKEFDYIDLDYIRELAIKLSKLESKSVLIHTEGVTEVVNRKDTRYRIEKFKDFDDIEKRKIQYFNEDGFLVTEII